MDIATHIDRAREGKNEAMGDLLEPYRNYLRILAAAQMGYHIGLRVSPSDVVQDTMLAAHQDFRDFKGSSAAEFSRWLRTILARCLLKAIERNVKAEKRDVRREVSLNGRSSTTSRQLREHHPQALPRS